MSKLQNRKIATLIAAVAIIAATLLGTMVSLNRAASKVEDTFYSGVYLKSEGYTQPGIDAHLNSRIAAANGMLAIIGTYSELDAETVAFRAARENLINAERPAQKGRANDAMQQSFIALRDAAEEIEMSARDISDLDKFYTTFNGAQAAILGSGYNLNVLEFLDGTLGAFPVVVLKRLVPVRTPQMF